MLAVKQKILAYEYDEIIRDEYKEIPNLQAHSKADEKHSDMFLPFLSEFATGEMEKLAIQAAKESLDLNAIFRKGIAVAQEMLPA